MWTEVRTDMTKLIVAFRNSAKEPNKPRGIESVFLLDPTQHVFLVSFSPGQGEILFPQKVAF
jgi:hypothetical protein